MRKVRIATIFGREKRMCIARKAGLAITRSAHNNGLWTITHLRTGRRLGPLSDLHLREARLALALAAACGDWTDVELGNVPQLAHDAVGCISAMVHAQ